MNIRYDTWDQFLIKSDMGLYMGCRSLKFHFHWKFWKPKKLNHWDTIYFGRYVSVDLDEVEELNDG